jgi:D-sedoheptulose 7-phosphate isomerase
VAARVRLKKFFGAGPAGRAALRNGNHNSLRQFPVERSYSVQEYFEQLARLLPQLPFDAIDQMADIFLEALVQQHSVFVFGNGGSAASASHLVCDMNKGLGELPGGPRMKVMALTDNVPVMTALANDYGYEHVFSEQLKNFLKPRDVVLAVSGSGNSPNVLLALQTARRMGAVTTGVAGYEGGAMKVLCDVCAVVPSDDMRMIEDMHHAMLHSVFTAMRERLLAGQATAAAMRLKK